MKTTLYGNGEATNEFGHPKVPKETNFVHAVYKIRDPLPRGTIENLCREFMHAHGRAPSQLFVQGGSSGTRSLGFFIDGVFVWLDIHYEAQETVVA